MTTLFEGELFPLSLQCKTSRKMNYISCAVFAAKVVKSILQVLRIYFI